MTKKGKEIIQEALEAAQQTVAGDYPEGKVNDADEGALLVAVGIENGRITMQFPKPVAWLAMEPAQAIEVGADLIRRAYKEGEWNLGEKTAHDTVDDLLMYLTGTGPYGAGKSRPRS
jgi:hypothetical protein